MLIKGNPIFGFRGRWLATFTVILVLSASSTRISAQGAPKIVWSQPGHTAKVSTVKFSPDGTLLASGGADNNVRFWHAGNGVPVRTLRQPFGGVNTVAFSPNGAVIAVGTAAFNQNLNIWRVADGALLFGRISAHANGTTGVAYSPDGQFLATGGRDRTTKIWAAGNMTLLRTLNDGSRVLALAYAPNGSVIASGAQSSIHIWRVSDGALLRTINPGTSGMFAVAISPDSTLVAANSGNGIGLWNMATGTLVHELPTPTDTTPTFTAFSPDNQILLTGNDALVYPNESGVIRFWRVSDGALLKFYDQQTGPAGVSVAWSPSGSAFAYGRYDGLVAVALK
jgi:WD40 repeat protein